MHDADEKWSGGDGTEAVNDNVDPVERTRRTYERIAPRYHERTRDEEDLLPAMDRFHDGLPERPVVLDAGCGPGRDARHLVERGCRVVGLDIAAAQLAVATDHAPGASLTRADLRRVPLPDRAVDGVWCVASLLHLPRDDCPAALTELSRVLRPGGRMFVSTAEGNGVELTHGYGTETGRYVVEYRPEEFAGLLREAGLSVLDREGGRGDQWIAFLAERPAES